MATIVIDPGHGRPDPGAVGPTGLTEAEVVLDAALRLERLLQAPGRRLILTRRDHNLAGPIPASLRTNRAMANRSLRNRVEAARLNAADLFVSIHANAAANPSAHGFEVFHNARGKAAAYCIFGAMRTRLRSHRARRCDPASFYVLRHNPAPAVLVELEFISNPNQESIFRKPDSLEFYARTLALGVEDWLLDFAKIKEGN